MRGDSVVASTMSVQMEEKQAVVLVINMIRDYAISSRNEVKRGLATPRLAAALLQKYGSGMIDAVATIYESRDSTCARAR